MVSYCFVVDISLFISGETYLTECKDRLFVAYLQLYAPLLATRLSVYGDLLKRIDETLVKRMLYADIVLRKATHTATPLSRFP